MHSISLCVSRKSIGTAIAPSRWQASSGSGKSRPLCSSIATRSPARTPRAARAPATRAARAWRLGVRALDAVEHERHALRARVLAQILNTVQALTPGAP